MKALRIIRNYLCYCGIEKDEFNALKKDAYVSNFGVWWILHGIMAGVFAILLVNSLLSNLLRSNMEFYLAGFAYSLLVFALFFYLKKDSLAAQLLIYLSISGLFLFGAFLTQNRPDYPGVTFIVMLIITPMFMIDKPYFMAFELCVASVIYLTWMRIAKPPAVWQLDLVNCITFSVVGFLLHVVANSIRIREFVLTRKINLQKDLDELTGLKNKDALTRAINAYLADETTDKGIMFILDVDRFKAINDTWGHDVGDSVIHQIGAFLGQHFPANEVVGRFGGDEFIVFLRGTDREDDAARKARDIITGVSRTVTLPDETQKVSVSCGIAIYHGQEKNYSEIFKKADTALYRSKADPEKRFCIFE